VAEEFEAGTAEHVPFDLFRLRVDAFRPAVVVRERDRGGGGLEVEFVIGASENGDRYEIMSMYPKLREDALPPRRQRGWQRETPWALLWERRHGYVRVSVRLAGS
jgi:hypothetical protein